MGGFVVGLSVGDPDGDKVVGIFEGDTVSGAFVGGEVQGFAFLMWHTQKLGADRRATISLLPDAPPPPQFRRLGGLVGWGRGVGTVDSLQKGETSFSQTPEIDSRNLPEPIRQSPHSGCRKGIHFLLRSPLQK